MKKLYLPSILLMIFYSAFSINPVNRSATRDVRKVLNYLMDLKGKGILTGQQNLASDVMRWTDEVVEITGKYPALLGEDFSYGEKAFKKRLDVVNAATEQWENGGLVTISWHQVNPDHWNGTVNEGPFEDTQKPMSEVRFNQLLSDGTEIHEKFIAHIDTIAAYLKKLQKNGVVVLWRPYHEMNGNWFWWGNKTSFKELWKMMYKRYTNYHHLNNLIWVWSPNISRKISDFYPGDDYVDLVGLDGYTDGLKNWDNDTSLKSDINELKSLTKHGIVSFTELGWLPEMEWLEGKRPEFIWFLCWWTHITTKNTKEEIHKVYHHPYAINRDRVNWKSFHKSLCYRWPKRKLGSGGKAERNGEPGRADGGS